MAQPDPGLSGDILHPLSTNIKSNILAAFFGPNSVLSGPYFDYYLQQCKFAMLEDDSDEDQAGNIELVPIITHSVIVGIVQDFKNGVLKSAIRNRVCRDTSVPTVVASNTIDLAARLYLMVQLGGPRVPGLVSLQWQQEDLRSCVAEIFEPGFREPANFTIEKTINVYDIEYRYGIRVIWTDNLREHLHLRNGDEEVAIFHHAAFLDYHQSGTGSSIFPTGLIEKTLRTLQLLIPQGNRRCVEWFRQYQEKYNLDPSAATCGYSLNSAERHISEFGFWRERLIILKEACEEKKSSKKEKEKETQQWYNFWVLGVLVVIMTFVFGVIQCIEGGIQVYKAYNPS